MIEEGKTYTTRGGRVVGPMKTDDEGDFTQEGCNQVWMPNGTVWCEVGDESEEYINFKETPITTSGQYTRILEALSDAETIATAKRIHEALQ